MACTCTFPAFVQHPGISKDKTDKDGRLIKKLKVHKSLSLSLSLSLLSSLSLTWKEDAPCFCALAAFYMTWGYKSALYTCKERKCRNKHAIHPKLELNRGASRFEIQHSI